MHNSQFEIDGEAITVAFNSDWSGQAVILIGDRNITVPAELFLRMARIVNDRAISTLIDEIP